MDNATADKIVLLPIKPEYANAIQQGTKTIEFRKREFRRLVKYVVVYASSPCKQILGFFELGNTIVENPEILWKQFGSEGAISKSAYDRYYEGSTSAVGLCIRKFTPLSRPIELSQIKKGMKAPQSYCYLDSKSFDLVRKYA